jgi:pimeloyl-ACP methyl ester carboxylesterase
VEAQALAPERPVGLVGASFGAGWGLCAMSRAGHAFRFAVLEGAFPTLPEFWHHYPVAQAALRLSQVVAPSFERGLRPERDAARVIGAPPVLLLYGADDVYTTPTHGERMRAACATCTSAELHVLPDVQHTFALRDAPAQYRELVLCFLDGR